MDLTGIFGDKKQEELAAEYSSGGSVLPPGKYKFIIMGAEGRPCKNNGKGVLFTFETAQGDKVTNWVNIKNANEKAELIGRKELAKIATCAGIKELTNSDQLVGMSLVLKLVVVDNEFTGNDGKLIKNKKNEIKGYFPATEKVGADPVIPTETTTGGTAPLKW